MVDRPWKRHELTLSGRHEPDRAAGMFAGKRGAAALGIFRRAINKLRAAFGRVVVGLGLHVPHGEHGDLSGEAQGEHERAVFHNRHYRVVEVWVHHSSVSFLLKRGLARGKPRSSRSR
jgi:hypothetical protein